MKISVNWLKDFLPSFSPDIPVLVERLTFLGLEVEEVHEAVLPDERVVVGRILEVGPHPDADRLRMCMVDTGEGEPLQIVCGAPNVKPEMLVPVATAGARLAMEYGKPFVIKPSKIRGQRSFGMICAADELGLSGDHSGVMELDAACVVGEPFARYLKADTILEIAVTPNRPDVLSHLGIARELASSPSELSMPAAAAVEFNAVGSRVEILDSAACPSYAAIVIEGVKVGPSPAWLSGRLESIGLRPKNNIVDITNYFLHALGQPMHAFDLHTLEGERVVVRSDVEGQFMALNQQLCRVEKGMPVICDAEKPVAIAGVMGGLDSAVTEESRDILLEVAYFSPSPIRRSARLAGISSDSSYRFERGVDPSLTLPAARSAVAMILELAGGRVAEACHRGEARPSVRELLFRPQKANALLGTDISDTAMQTMLERIGFMVLSQTDEGMSVAVPSFRVDVVGEVDLIEEVARLYGYDNIIASPRMAATYPDHRTTPEFFPDFLRSIMVALNFREVLTNPLMKREDAELFSERTVSALNPISEGLEVLRPSLLPGILKVMGHNIRHGNRDMRLFEVASTFQTVPEDERSSPAPLDAFSEHEGLVFALSGSRFPRSWNQPADGIDFYDALGAAQMLLEKLNLLDKSAVNIYNESTVSIDLPLTTGKKTATKRVGLVQQLQREVLSRFGIEQDVFVAVLDVSVLEAGFNPVVAYEPPSKFPVVQRDLSFILPGGVSVQSLVELVKETDALIRNVSVFDLFERQTGGKGERSVALGLEIADYRGTLQDERVNDIILDIGNNAESKLGAVIRQV
ncbi:MAG: phenylalanine--tRNA ligase subunit beta [Candidatus Chlorobium antarcticum]|nr:phenylalanine--tRNA ligase subunit beta [Candidatus Chlorobium antarcticum]